MAIFQGGVIRREINFPLLGDKSKLGKEHKIKFKASASLYNPSSTGKVYPPIDMPRHTFVTRFSTEIRSSKSGVRQHDRIILIRKKVLDQVKNYNIFKSLHYFTAFDSI
jgi:hypothetical protein